MPIKKQHAVSLTLLKDVFLQTHRLKSFLNQCTDPSEQLFEYQDYLLHGDNRG